MKPFKPDHYLQAAVERMRQAHILYRAQASHALAMYVAGVSVECMLRAFKGRRDPTFDERHDLLRLFKASGMLEIDSARLTKHGVSPAQEAEYRRALQTAVNELAVLWSNDYRFASEDRLRAHLRSRVDFRKGLKGDILKASALRLLNAAQRFIDKGIVLWKI